METFFKSFKKLRLKAREERRRHSRYAVFIKVHYMVQNCWYKGYIRNISEGGAYIQSAPERKVSSGEDILLVVELKVLLDQIKGRIIWMGSHGFALAFRTSEPGYSRLKALLAAQCFT
jgi:Tfp pilus assembly protein PilZ